MGTTQTFAKLVRSTESSPEPDEHRARMLLAQAHSALRRDMGSDNAAEMARHRATAVAIYQQLATGHPNDPDPVPGIGNLTEDPLQLAGRLQNLSLRAALDWMQAPPLPGSGSC